MGFRLRENWGAYFGAGVIVGIIIGQILTVSLPWGKQLPSLIGYIIFIGLAIGFLLLASYEPEKR